MAKFWSMEIDPILSVGRSLEDVGVHNWALSREDALAALTKLADSNVAVLGGDIYSVNGNFIEPNYDSWYCNRDHRESDSDYVARSIVAARNYIMNYGKSEDVVLFAIVPKV